MALGFTVDGRRAAERGAGGLVGGGARRVRTCGGRGAGSE